jgi:LIVCS family branched-chain amino acid:cation transporter
VSQSLKRNDVIGLGFMLCAFFLGAGNIIFPPSAGLQAGDNVLYSMIGFLLTGVGLPLIGVIGIAIAGGSLKSMTDYLPAGTGTVAAVVLFIVIGPAFATPRTSLVTWDLAVKPLVGQIKPEDEYTYQVIVTSLFFVVSTFFAIFRGKLIDNIGKVLTPLLFLLLVLLAIGVIYAPWGTIQAPIEGVYSENPLVKGFLEGYNTMDAFAALMFGGLVVDILRGKGVTDGRATRNYLIIAGFIAAAGLSFVYISLFWLGATAGGNNISDPTSGALILSSYVQFLFGDVGVYILSGVVLLACLTTAVGLLSACGDYFSRLLSFTRLNYQAWVVIFALISAWVANVGLKALIATSVPSLYALYPMVITILTLTFLRELMRHPKLVYRLVMAASFVMGMLAAFKMYFALAATPTTTSLLGVSTAHWQSAIDILKLLPLYKQDMEWLLPVAITLVIAFVLDNLIPLPGTHKEEQKVV